MSDPTGTEADPPNSGSPKLPLPDLRDEIAELEYQALLAERSHLDAALEQGRSYTMLGLLAAVLGVLTTGSALDFAASWTWLKAIFGDMKNVTGVLALLLTITTAWLNFRDPKGMRDRHLAAGRRFAALRMELRVFRRSASEETRESDTERLLRFIERHRAIADEAAQISDRHHRMAKLRLSSNVHYKDLREKTGRAEANKAPPWYMCCRYGRSRRRG